ncbi:LPS O-antigen chain length determinant protein, WzzB/FepE family [Mucilaginibacter pineti]|uniref:LPS O-antigen chain length determinant protein, WzzB/FepE family n=1 Tax=Mucilaginibacter pineti TaxID=1391627 RepID=A0A1G6YZU3_9SPHI|nr:hypothetical protein [Mucilaginibacter pineti]SDD95821.1 LPS O-antigen chain length determinant protein, WzzB/FepE family [Mucilaginibacter pineti]
MSTKDQDISNNNSPDEISVKELLVKIKSSVTYIKSKWLIILLFSLIGAIAGLGYSLYKKINYTAECTFVLQESAPGGGLSQYAGLASLAGINLGGGGSGIFEGDNIIELYKSRTMLARTLLSEVNFDSQKQSLIERYITHNKLRSTWKEKDHITDIKFTGDPEKFDRKQDSLITNIVAILNKKALKVAKPDKKLNIISVQCKSDDELFAKMFTNKLVETVNGFYIQTKTKISYQNINILQKQADSLKTILNYALTGVASSIDAAPNANPFLSRLKVSSQRKQIDVESSKAMYGEIEKNLEIAKIALRQEMPLIQIVDKPILPLSDDRVSKKVMILTAGLLGGFIGLFFIFIKKLLQLYK